MAALAGFIGGVIVGVATAYSVGTPIGEGLPPRRYEATVLLPLLDNDQKPFSAAAWGEVLGSFANEFGGATLGPEQEGCWLDDAGKLRREPVRPLVISFEPRLLSRFRITLDEAGRQLGQEAVYVRFETAHIEVRRVSKGESKIGR
jgi:hypothetical protein